ncbi:MAG: cbb3-type cytochrome oxidase assembly protein CcoS [Robiginitomaculum sp.]|nr:cbb3-type cytochrome oxidase assembly protein CcoS [Robiginitomaculum sp.]
MTALIWLIPLAMILGILALTAFFWTIRSGQYEDTKGDASRILYSEDRPIVNEDEV